MKEIEFKIKDNKLYVTVSNKISNKQFLECFKERIENLLVTKKSFDNEIVLNIPDRYLDDREILQLFDILEETEVFYLGKVVCKNKSKENLIIYKGNFRGGQTRFFEKSLLLVGSINKGSKIIVNGDLYVLGKINGDVELKDKECKIYCESIFNSLVKIGDTYKLYSEEMFDKEIFYKDKNIYEKDYKKGEIENVKSNSSYIR